MTTLYTITVRALEHPDQPERSFAFSSDAARASFRTGAKAAGWSTVRTTVLSTSASAAAALAELAALLDTPEGD